MWALTFFLLLLAVGGAFVFTFRRQRKEIAALQKAREKLQIEEDRVFEFLRGLGEAFSENIRLGDLHRLIVEGACRIVDAHGGALYLVDREGTALMPAFITKGCPPLVAVPPHVLQQAESTPQALESYLRLHPLTKGEGPIGTVWRDGEPLLLTGEDVRLKELRDPALQTDSAMIVPLIYGRRNLGVMAVSNSPMSDEFRMSDFSLFKAIAEQSAFALYNAIVYSQANEKKRLDLELQMAQDIQRILLPSTSPQVDHFEVSGINIPALHVSGDYFDYVRIDENRCGVVIADVSGKGVPASLIMAMCRSVLRSNASETASASEVLHKVNRQLYPDIKEDMFISMAYVILDSASNRVTLCRAGHDAPILFRAATKTVEKLNPPGMALGIDSGDVFDRITGDFFQTLEPGDCLVLYTDGVTEALDRKGLEFGMKRMLDSIQRSAANGAQGIIDRLTDEVREFIGSHPQHDDITMIVIRRI